MNESIRCQSFLSEEGIQNVFGNIEEICEVLLDSECENEIYLQVKCQELMYNRQK